MELALYVDMTTRATTNGTKLNRTATKNAPAKRVIAVGKKVDGRWQVRTSLWRYLASTALSNQ